MTRVLSYAGAIREATQQEMDRDPSVFVMGIGVDDFKAVFGTTQGLVERFGSQRVFDTPLSEDSMTGFAIGAAIAGMRPIHVHIRMDFILLAMNQIVNVAAKSRYMFGGQVSVPIVVRSVIGRSWGQGAQHSQGLQSLFMHVPGLKVIAPSTPYDAKGALIQSIRDDNPVMFVEHRMLHYTTGEVPEEPYVVPFGQSRVLGAGTDITIVAISYMAVEAMRAREHLRRAGISAEVIDPVSLAPLDVDGITKAVLRTGRLLVVDSAWTNCGASAEILAQVVERLDGRRPVRLRRMGFAPVPCPTTKNLEEAFYPNQHTIASTAYGMCLDKGLLSTPVDAETPEISAFRGPF